MHVAVHDHWLRPARGRAAAAAVAVGALVVLAPAAALAAAAPPATPSPTTPQAPFGLRPAQSATVPTVGGHFTYSVAAGATVNDAVVVENLGTTPLTVQAFGADLIPLAGGGFSPAQIGAPMKSVGAWVAVQPGVTMASLQEVTVPFTVTVPASTFSGDYAGAIVVQNSPTPGRGVAIQTRVALEIQIHVTGATAHLDGRIGGLQTKTSGRTVHFSAVLTNTGNESFSFDGSVHLQKGGTAVDVAVPMRPGGDFLFPGQHVTLTGSWANAPRWGTVTARAVADAEPASGDPGTFTDAPVRLRFFPWLLVILALVALLLLLLVTAQTWRRREQWKAWMRHARQRRRAVRRFKESLSA
ncbi:MAG TPA: hypothetical protein VGR90_10720 [Acidimicrobiales bacterium]|nr:hypothetical protein [Acidimicrobiales bacterium]